MSAYARVHDGQVVEVLELTDDWIAGLEANSNPKRAEFYQVTVDPVPAYNKETQYTYSVFTVENLAVRQSWIVDEITE